MPPPLDAVATIACLSDEAVAREIDLDGRQASVQFALYDLLRHEQALAIEVQLGERSEVGRIMDLAQARYGDLVGLLAGRVDALLDTARDGEWSLRDLLRHAIAVELRYGAQVEWAATRRDEDPLAIPDERLPCDRLSPPEPEFAASRTGGLAQILELLGAARAATSVRLEAISSAALGRPSLWGTVEMSARMRTHQIAVHLAQVVAQGEKMLAGDQLSSDVRRIVRGLCAMRGAHELSSGPAGRTVLDARYKAIAEAIG
jgi:hypothetical protein